MPTLVAQALLEKGMLEGLMVSIWSVVNTTVTFIQDHPWPVVVVAALICVYVIFIRRG